VTTQFAGRTALVTGAGRGIGQAVALQLAAAGASLILIARSASQLAETKAMALSQGAIAGQVRFLPADLSDSGQRAAVLAAALGTMRVDILINNAATVEPLGPTGAIPDSELRRALEINVVAPFALTTAVLPGMVDAGWGRIVNVSSAVASHPSAMVGGNAYAATKAALEAHTVNLAAELVGTGVTVNAYRPGGVDTAMQAWIRQQDPERIGAALHERFARNYADGTLITPEHSASVLVGHLDGQDSGAIWDVSTAAAART
jgi:NAD(P)-dependent dehydrogenase (short-subunit alcohol dehydrogenase family)